VACLRFIWIVARDVGRGPWKSAASAALSNRSGDSSSFSEQLFAIFHRRTLRLAACSFSDQGGLGGRAIFFSADKMALVTWSSISFALM
jgi:hypothetical protein